MPFPSVIANTQTPSPITNFHFQNEPEATSYEPPNLFESFTMDSAEDPMPFLTGQSTYGISTDSINWQLPFGSPTASNTTRSTSTESEEHTFDDQLYMPFSAPISSAQTLSSLPTCHCLEQHSKLLCQLKRLEQPQHTASTLDVMLIAVQHSLETWQSLIRCRSCSCNDDQTVLLLSVMTMRFMLGCFQRLCLPNGEKHSPLDFSSPALGIVKLGSYEVTKHEQALVTSLFIVRALGKIKHALLSLKDKFFHSRRQKADADLTDEHHKPLAHPQVDVECVSQLLQSLDGTVQVVKDAAVNKDHLKLGDLGNSIESRVE